MMAALRSLEPDEYVPPGHGEPEPFAGSSHTYPDNVWEALRNDYNGDTLAAVVLTDQEVEF